MEGHWELRSNQVSTSTSFVMCAADRSVLCLFYLTFLDVRVFLRTTIQVKTHAQMVIRRIESGENVFTDLDEPLEKPEATTTVFSQRHVLKPIDANVPVKRKIAKKTVKPVKFGIATAKISPKQNPTFFVRPLRADYVCLDEHVTEKRDIDAALILRSLRTANNSDQV